MRSARPAGGFPPRPNGALMRTCECAWTWCGGLAHKAQDASRPTLTEEQAAAWAREMAETNEPGWEPNAAALLRAARGETGPTKPGAQ